MGPKMWNVVSLGKWEKWKDGERRLQHISNWAVRGRGIDCDSRGRSDPQKEHIIFDIMKKKEEKKAPTMNKYIKEVCVTSQHSGFNVQMWHRDEGEIQYHTSFQHKPYIEAPCWIWHHLFMHGRSSMLSHLKVWQHWRNIALWQKSPPKTCSLWLSEPIS